MNIPEIFTMKLSGSVVEYGYDYRYDKEIKKKIFNNQDGSIVPLSYNYIHSMGCQAGVAKLKIDEKGISADCYIYDTSFGRTVTEFINAKEILIKLDIIITQVESTTHGDKTIITKGTIREVSIVPVENSRYPVEIEKEEK